MKNTLLYFAYQSLIHAKGWKHFQTIWGKYPDWKSSLQPGRNSVSDEQAWLNFAALDYLRHHIQAHHRVFEYGGGGSTLFFCKLAGFVATVENDRSWFETLEQTVRSKSIQHWQGFFLPGEETPFDPARKPENPADFMSGSPNQGHLSYEQYAKAIHQFPDDHFDVVLVDGRVRPSCVQESLRHLKRGGLLVVDNMERPRYWPAHRAMFERDFETVVSGWYPVPYHPDFTFTLILSKK